MKHMTVKILINTAKQCLYTILKKKKKRDKKEKLKPIAQALKKKDLQVYVNKLPWCQW